MPKQGWPSMPKKLPSKTLREFRGVNKLDPFSIGDQYATDMKNVTSDKYPAFTTRAGYSLLGSAFSQKIQGLGTWKNNELHAVSNGSWYKYTGSAWSAAIVSGLSASAEYSFANFKGGFSDIFLLAANGVNPPKMFNGTTVSDLSGAPPTGNYIISYDNRLFCMEGNLLHASGLSIGTDWTSTGNDSSSYKLNIDTEDGETASALKPGIGHVTVFKPNSIHEILGSDPSNVRKQPITFEVGAINNKSVVTLNGIMFLIHRTGIYKYAGGSLPAREFSTPVQAYIDNMNAAASNLCAVGTDGQKIYFSIPVNSSTAPDALLVYDPKFDMWCVWNDFTTLHMTQSATEFFMGMANGKVVRLGGITDAGSTISWSRTSKPFSADQMSRKIRWMRMWVVCDVPAGSTLNVHVSPTATGDSNWVSAGSVSPASGAQSARIIFNPAQVANSNYLRVKFSGTGPSTIYEWDRDEMDFPIV